MKMLFHGYRWSNLRQEFIWSHNSVRLMTLGSNNQRPVSSALFSPQLQRKTHPPPYLLNHPLQDTGSAAM